MAGLPFVASSVGIHALYFWALGRAYRYGDFSRVYPMARGLGVALVPLIALPVFGERLSWLGSLGIGLVVLGIVALGRNPSQTRSAGGQIGAGTAWAIVTGLTIASYSLVDKAGLARAVDPVFGVHREPVAGRGTAGPAARRRLRRARGRDLRRARARVNSEGASNYFNPKVSAASPAI